MLMISSIGTFLPIRGHFVWDGMGVCGVDGVLRRRGVGKATGGVLVMSLSVFRRGVEGQSIARPVRHTSITLGAYVRCVCSQRSYRTLCHVTLYRHRSAFVTDTIKCSVSFRFTLPYQNPLFVARPSPAGRQSACQIGLVLRLRPGRQDKTRQMSHLLTAPQP